MATGDVTDREIELEALKTDREGMIAANAHRSFLGVSVMYDDAAFFALADKMRALIANNKTGGG